MKNKKVLKVMHYIAIALGLLTVITLAFGAGYKDAGDLKNYSFVSQILKVLTVWDIIFFTPYLFLLNKSSQKS